MGLMNFDSFAVVFCFYFYCMEHTRTLRILSLLLLCYVSILTAWNLQIDSSCNCKLFPNYLSFYFWLLSIEPKDWASLPWCSFEVSKYLMNLNSFKVIFRIKIWSNIKKYKLDTIQITIFISDDPVIVFSQNCIITN